MSLVIDKYWKAHPDYYDYENIINLSRSVPIRKKQYMQMGGGQSTNMECGVAVSVKKKHIPSQNTPPIHDYERSVLVEQGEIKFIYKQIIPVWGPCPRFDPRIDFCYCSYKLYKGNFLFNGPFRNDLQMFKYKLVLDKNPMPKPVRYSLYLLLNGSKAWSTREYYSGIYCWKTYKPEIPRCKGDWTRGCDGERPPTFKYIPKYFPHEV